MLHGSFGGGRPDGHSSSGETLSREVDRGACAHWEVQVLVELDILQMNDGLDLVKASLAR